MLLDIIMYITFLSLQNKYPATRFKCQKLDNKRYIDNQKVQVADEIKRDILKYLVPSEWQMMLYIIMCLTFLPVHNKYPSTRFVCQNFDS